MKLIITLVTFVFALNVNAFSLPEVVSPVLVHKYENSQANRLFVNVAFGESLVINDSNLEKLKGEIVHIDFVYTAFKREISFDQLRLNAKRIEAFVKLFPSITTDNPEWSVYEQTGASTFEEAESYFHGFVIHYGEKIDYQSQKKFFKPIQKNFSTVDIDNRKGGKAVYYTGSSIEMEQYSVAYKNGKQVEGVYQLQYREFRNQAEIALSGIPMVFSEEDSEIFNSVGMYELRASKDGEDLVLTKDAIIDFKCTAELDGVGFYKMEDSGNWSLEHEIEFNNNKPNVQFQQPLIYGGPFLGLFPGLQGQGKMTLKKYDNRKDIDNGAYQGYSRLVLSAAVDYDMLLGELNEVAYQSYQLQKNNGNELLQDITVQYEENGIHGILIPQSVVNEVVELVFMDSLSNLSKEQVGKTIIYKNQIDYASSGLRAVDRKYKVPLSTGLVNGLRSKSFGVYNCDQTKRIEEPLALKPTYYNKETGSQLNDLYVTCVIDLNLNASLSYHPNSIVANRQGNNKLLLFSMDNRIYFLDKNDFQNVNIKIEQVNFYMTEVSETVQTSEDLKELLDI